MTAQHCYLLFFLKISTRLPMWATRAPTCSRTQAIFRSLRSIRMPKGQMNRRGLLIKMGWSPARMGSLGSMGRYRSVELLETSLTSSSWFLSLSATIGRSETMTKCSFCAQTACFLSTLRSRLPKRSMIDVKKVSVCRKRPGGSPMTAVRTTTAGITSRSSSLTCAPTGPSDEKLGRAIRSPISWRGATRIRSLWCKLTAK